MLSDIHGYTIRIRIEGALTMSETMPCNWWKIFCGKATRRTHKSQQSRNKDCTKCFTVAMYLGQEPWLLGPKIHKNQVPWRPWNIPPGQLGHLPLDGVWSPSAGFLGGELRSFKILLFHKPNSIEYTLDVYICLLLDIPYDWAYHIPNYSTDIFVSLGVFH